MIHVLIVDDDNLVRKGLISSMPWDSYGMRIAGEAANGEKALEFMAATPIDLLLTDLAMPVMSGIELIRIARERHPEVAAAVLTLHQDFEYIQEALRLGAIDYIAKVQLEREHFGEMLGRIRSRIVAEKGRRSQAHAPSASDVFPASDAYALLSLRDAPEPAAYGSPAAGEAVAALGCWRTEGDRRVRIWMPEAGKCAPDEETGGRLLPPLPEDVRGAEESAWRWVRVGHAAGESLGGLHAKLSAYRERDFFYACRGNKPQLIEISFEELGAGRAEPSPSEVEAAKELLHSFRWLHDEMAFRELERRLLALKLPLAKLMQLLYGSTVEWNRIFRSVSPARIELPDRFASWGETARWLEAFRGLISPAGGRAHLSGEVRGSVMAAVKIVHDELELPLFAIDVARRVNLSRSYFNQVFKEWVGSSFNEYLRQTRIDKAREYLVQTAKPIQWVAEHTGYADEKYFSRTFREQTGMLPSEYRQRQG
ncbi:helix-turn-helix domain-containing protein [Cohnella fermenti]|uniref:Helix-turn-helix domain-containing protein n=1 Tax=Cohnella fermenti TaxID=2565925 RepID=A0A4S4BNF1_9BACL|nr:helix-turn-helix domain-containing protein [Cohnella fermenti]THF76394.1 helix-turn-helix domain-containing protein [Cohnella fermenti]